MQTRIITQAEMRKVNNIIYPRFGLRYTISGGSVITEPDGDSYHVSFREYHEANETETSEKVGELIKAHFYAKEVYNFGKKLA